MNIVLDTNIFVAAGFNRRSHSAQIIQALQEGEHTLVWNGATRRETRKILEQIPPLSWEDFADLFRAEGEVQQGTQPERFSAIEDPDDRKFAALATTAGATLVTNDDHLLSKRGGIDVPVVTAGEFVAEHS